MCTGIALAIFSMDGNTSNEKDVLNVSARCVEIVLFNSIKTLKFWSESYLDQWICSYLAKIFYFNLFNIFYLFYIKFTSCASVGVINTALHYNDEENLEIIYS